jgi:plasmid stabilization system protein ParE
VLPVARRRQKRLEWSFQAARDVLPIESWIALDNAIAALEVVEHIIVKAELLRGNPSLGRRMAAGGPRKLALTRYPYSIYCHVTRSAIRVVRVLHQARRFP